MPDAHDPSKRHAPDDADDGPRAAGGSDLRADREALPRAPRPARRRVRQGVVQAAAPRHGTRLALPRPVGPGAAAVAGPRPRRRSRADRRRGHRRPQGARSSPRDCRSRSWSPPPGRRRRASAAPTSAAAPTARGSASRRRRTGRSTSRPSWPRCCRRSSRSSRTSTRSQSGGKRGLARRPDRPRRLRGRRAGGEGRRARRHGPVRARAHRRLAGADRRGVVRRARADRRRVPQLPPRRREAAAGDAAARPGQPADADRARDDGARRRHARPERQLRAVRSTASSPTGPRR